MLIAIQRFLLLLLLIGIACYYVNTHYHLKDVLDYTHEHPHAFVSAPVTDYSVAMVYFLRDERLPAIDAFNQLLTDFPTSQYTEDSIFRLGECYEDQREWLKARQAYQQYMELYPQGKSAQIVQKNYDRIKFN